MATLATYQHRYKYAKLRREHGILEVTFHYNDGPLLWGVHPNNVHEELGGLFYDIGRDRDNHVVILTGTGDDFCVSGHPGTLDGLDAVLWDRIYKEGKDLLMNLLDIEVPVIGAVNGPAHIHAELLLLSDIVIASNSATFADAAHAPNGIVPADGVHVIWQMLLGVNRARAFLLTGQQLDAATALALGLVHEVIEPDRVLARAWDHARSLARHSLLMLRYSRVAMVQHIKRRLVDDLGYGLALEGLAALTANIDLVRGKGE
jgi:enoyl-CoA hydratase/carnithine racemase